MDQWTMADWMFHVKRPVVDLIEDGQPSAHWPSEHNQGLGRRRSPTPYYWENSHGCISGKHLRSRMAR